MRILDLFCKAGGCSMGYHRAGFEVIGVDIEPQPNYPFKFIQGDALEVLRSLIREKQFAGYTFDAIHASPPCQRYSGIQGLAVARNGGYKDHVDLVDPTRELLIETNLPYVIENVVGAPLIDPITLCGATFGLKVYRHRLFESNMLLFEPPHEPHNDSTPSAGNGISPKGFISVCGTGGVRGMTAKEILNYWSMAMGIDWMNRKELAQAIPPAYTEWIGNQLREQIRTANAA